MTEIADDQLRTAVATAHSWRGVLRSLGLPESSSARLRAVQRRAHELGIETSHFTGPRKWSDQALVDAVARGHSWAEVGAQLGLSARGNGSLAGARRRAARLGLDTDHLDGRLRPIAEAEPPAPRSEYLHRAGPALAAAWYLLCGYEVLWPLEPCRYDLGVARNGGFVRVQVKTTTHRADGSAVVSLSSARRRGRVAYGPDEVDQFFVVDDELNCYAIPAASVSGRYQVYLRRFEPYRVVARGQLLPPARPATA